MNVLKSFAPFGVFLGLAAVVLPSCATRGRTDNGDVIEAVRMAADAYVEAINRGDANGFVACWTEDGEFVNESTGVHLKGRKAIHERLTQLLAEDPKTKAETTSSTIHLVAPDVAVEQGRSRFATPSGPVEQVTFVAVYVKRDGQWKIHRIWQTDLPFSSHYEHLADLAWMIGEWTDEADGKKTRNVCRWSKNRNFITRTFEVSDKTGLLIKGTEVIGWDPADKRVRSWTFDSKGGFAEGVWSFKGGRWQLQKVNDHKPAELAKHQEALRELDWMVGDWVDRGEDETVETTCQWVGDTAFLARRFKVSVSGKLEQEGVQIIGWDPEQKHIRSWLFDTDGGFAEATWSWKDNMWSLNNRHVLPDGRKASSIAIFKPVDDDTFTWRRVAQELDGELLPNLPEVKVSRKPAGK